MRIWDNVNIFTGENPDVKKFVFTKNKLIAESVLYRYGSYTERTVICCSVQSGCPVGCTFCGTGDKFIGNLSATEIVQQVIHIIDSQDIDHESIKKFQIMFMSMGEPFLNFEEVEKALTVLNVLFPDAQLLLSTIGPDVINIHNNKFIEVSSRIKKVGLQFSIHKSTDKERDALIPFKNKLTLEEIALYGKYWFRAVNVNTIRSNKCRPVYLNYCIDGTNNTVDDFIRLKKLFDPRIFYFTFSVICSPDETMKDAGYRNLDAIREFEQMFIEAGYNTRIFDPAGQDDIGGGCGQLWYVQDFIKSLNDERSIKVNE